MDYPNLLDAPTAPARPHERQARAARWLAWSLWSVVAAQVGAGLLLAALNQLAPRRLIAEYVVASALAALAFATVGALVAARRPGNFVGWLLCAAGLFGGLGAWSGQYARYALVTRPGELPLGDLATWLYICPSFGPFVG